jgi:malonyl-CoA/methylmalonyl-CoA synthetase
MRLSFILSGVKRRTGLTGIITHHCLRAREQCGINRAIRYSPYLVRMASTLPRTPIFNAIAKHDPASLAIVHSSSDRSFSYGSLLHDVAAAKDNLTAIAGGKSLQGERIAFLAENGYDYVVTFLSILAHNAIALPLAFTHPSSELRYILENSEAALVLSTQKFQEKAKDVLEGGNEDEKMSHTPKLEILSKIETGATSAENVKFEDRSLQDAGFMLYTSGTTNRPKGVVLSIDNITAQALSLIEAWRYTPSDLLLHVLPLHHIHGTINALFTPLIAGSTVEFAYPFNADTVFKRLALPFLPDVPSDKRPVTFLTVVPTIYNRLLASFPQLDAGMQAAVKTAISPEHMRVNISGSAALPTPTKQAWTDLSGGNVLLERYGMTEVGMALSCGLAYEDRVDGSVGWPLPGVQVRLVDTETNEVIRSGQEQTPDGKQREGEIQLRGPTVFREYFRNPAATASEFVEDDGDGLGKWFKTGDVAVRQPGPSGAGRSEQKWAQGPMYFIRGRKSVDIIKTGGEKVSALEVERELLSLPEVAEAAVMGVQNEQWGQKVAAVVVLSEAGKSAGKGGKAWGALDMRRALKDRLANYKVPMEMRVVDGIPRNAMGKVNKKSLVKEVFPEAS